MRSACRSSSAAHSVRPVMIVSLVISLLLLANWLHPAGVQGVSGNIVISQVYGGGGNSGAPLKNDFIELFNRGNNAVDVTGWSVQYASATGSSWQVTALSGSLPPGGYFLVQQAGGANGADLPTPDATGSITMSSSNGKVALVSNTTPLSGTCPASASIVDLVGYGSSNCSEGSPAPALGNTTAAVRAGNGCSETDNNSTDFAAAAPVPRNSAATPNACGSTTTGPSGTGAATPNTLLPGATTLLTVTVTPGTNPASTGLAVRGDLSPIGGAGSQEFFDNGTNGDATAGDSIFSFQATVAGGTSAGAKSLAITITDDQSRTGNATVALTIQSPPVAVHDIQGNGTTSALAGQNVITSGIVTALKSNGFFIQTPDAIADNDLNTSEGIFVFTSSAPPATAVIGNLVNVSGTVQEFIPSSDPLSASLTELVGPLSVSVASTGNALPAPIMLTATDTNPGGSLAQLEKYEGMRVQANSLTVVAPTQGSISEANATSNSNGIFYAVITGVARPFREPGIEVPESLPAMPCCIPQFDGNPERLRVDSDAQPGTAALEVTTGAIVTGVVGVLDYGARTYTILPDAATMPVVTNNRSATALPDAAADEFTIAAINLERFYDDQDDPAISEPVLTATAYQNRLHKAALTIRTILRAPDVLGIVEIENLATLQALATKINNDAVAAGQANPGYQAFLEEGNDPGGIDVGVLIKGTRVSVVEIKQEAKTETYTNPTSGLQDILHDRPPLLVRATIQPPAGAPFPVTVIVNHLRSLTDIADAANGPRVRAKRLAQAQSLAKLIQARQIADTTEHIIAVGDFNAFQFNDGYVDVLGTISGTPAAADNVLLASADLVNPDLVNLTGQAAADEKYSFVFGGNAQALDHMLVTTNLLTRVSRFSYARSNADFPESWRNDSRRPERLSDHDAPVAYFKFAGTVASVSAASFQGASLASESIAAAFGTGLATETVAAASLPLPTILAGTTVTVKDSGGTERQAPLFFVSSGQVNYQIPTGTLSGSAEVIITAGNGQISSGMTTINDVAPALFSANADGMGVAAAYALRVRPDNMQIVEPVAQLDQNSGRLVAVPLDLSPDTDQMFLVLFGSGIRNHSDLTQVSATVGGESVEVLYAGTQGGFVGLDQVNLRLPRTLSGRGDVDVILSVTGKTANTVRVNIK